MSGITEEDILSTYRPVQTMEILLDKDIFHMFVQMRKTLHIHNSANCMGKYAQVNIAYESMVL